MLLVRYPNGKLEQMSWKPEAILRRMEAEGCEITRFDGAPYRHLVYKNGNWEAVPLVLNKEKE